MLHNILAVIGALCVLSSLITVVSLWLMPRTEYVEVYFMPAPTQPKAQRERFNDAGSLETRARANVAEWN